MITYIIRSTACALVFLLVYRLLLQREKMYVFNRIYLLTSLLASLFIPLITITFSTNMPATVGHLYLPLAGLEQFDPPVTVQETTATPVQQVPTFSWTNIAIATYALVALILLIRFIRNLYLLRRATKSESVGYAEAQLVLLDADMPAHSFLRHIFMSKADYADLGARDALLAHELSHVRQRHSWDVLFLEILQIIYWFNPLLPFYKKAMQFNHELLADNSVINTLGNVRSYQHLLLEKIELQCRQPLVSSFNYLITKKR